jgi:hypothetical protein
MELIDYIMLVGVAGVLIIVLLPVFRGKGEEK